TLGLEQRAQRGGGSDVARFEFRLLPRTVHAGEVNHRIACPHCSGQLFRSGFAGDGQNFETRLLRNDRTEVPADESVRAGNKDPHGYSTGVAGRPATRSRMKSSFISSFFIPSTSRRSVFAEV